MPTGTGWDRTDPFAEGAGPFVASGPHGLAVGAILAALGSGERLIHLTGASGAGKTRVAAALARAWREPGRRAAVCDAGTGLSLPGELVRLMSGGAALPGLRGDAWPRLAELVRLARLQRQSWLLVIDRVEALESAEDLSRLSRIDAQGGASLVILTVGNDLHVDPEAFRDDRATTLRLPALTRSEAVLYLSAKLNAGGWLVDQFHPGALARLHAEARGVPRLLDRLARRALAAFGNREVSAADIDAMLESAHAPAGWVA